MWFVSLLTLTSPSLRSINCQVVCPAGTARKEIYPETCLSLDVSMLDRGEQGIQ